MGETLRENNAAIRAQCEKVRECDPDGVIEEALRGGAHGTIYRLTTG